MRYSINAIALATAASALSTSKLPPVVRLFGLSDLHVDYAANLETVKSLQRPPGEGHLALIIAGDVTHNRTTLHDALTALRETFDDVFYVPGNHEAWVTSTDRADGIADSVAKLRACEALAEACGCTTRPRTLEDAAGRVVKVAPLRGWYHASHDREPSVLPDDDGSRGFSRRWADYRKCRWPPELLGRHGKEAVAHGMGAGDHALSAYFAATNDIARDGTPLVTFSHYAPRFECVPEKRFLLEPCLAKVSGSDHLGELVLRLKPDVHVFGHTHIPIDLDLDGTYYAQWPLGSPREQARQCARAKALGPLELFRTDLCRNQIIATRLRPWLNHNIHAIDATPARRRVDAGLTPLDSVDTTASSPRNDLVKNHRVHPTHWLISTQARTRACDGLATTARPTGRRGASTTATSRARRPSRSRRPVSRPTANDGRKKCASRACRTTLGMIKK